MTKAKAPKAPLQVPFKANGDMITFSDLKYPEVITPATPSYDTWYKPASWVENHVFEADLTFKCISTGRSAVNGIFTNDASGARYSTFQSELEYLIPKLVNGKIHGKFTFEKRGQNYGMCMAPDGPQ